MLEKNVNVMYQNVWHKIVAENYSTTFLFDKDDITWNLFCNAVVISNDIIIEIPYNTPNWSMNSLYNFN